MVAKAFSIEDGDQQGLTLVGARKRVYSDIDLTFAKKLDGDVFKKQNAAAVKQSIKNLLMTNYTEKPFKPFFGGNLNDFLFELNDGIEEEDIEDRIETAIRTYEPRADVLDVKVISNPDNYDIRVTVSFKVVSTSEEVTLNLSLTRLR
tara:strand:- start:5065 stop:5508 length:444 start_codon:yes stop_codon:yes gene_type:complete